MSNPQTGNQPSLADRLKSVRVGLRQDLDVSRHVFRGEPAYVVRDAMTFQSHRLSPADYEIFISIDASRTLDETFNNLVERRVLARDAAEVFYQFVFMMHRLGFLNLPVSDDKMLFKRYQARQQARKRQRLLGFLFLQIPLVNPDAFLSRTIHCARWLYSMPFFIAWLVLAGCAGYIVTANWDELVQPIHGLLATRNLGLMWITLVLLKVLHEFGHAYACKHLGGHVPEMGAYLIAFTPCAYVDATASWGFPRKRDRVLVSLGGVYVETTIASLAVFVWAATGPSLLNSIAYNVIFLASVVTLLFNINPLMRYDGYYVASDLLEIPNLRQRSTQYVLGLIKRLLLGVKNTSAPDGLRMRAILLTFGVSATIYRTLVLVGIAAVIATKFVFIGLGLAGFFLFSTAFGIAKRLFKYLWFAQETATVRYRAVALSAVVFLIIPGIIGFVPLPASVNAAASVTAECETVVRAAVPGFVDYVGVERGHTVQPGELLAGLTDLSADERVARARAAIEASAIRKRAYEFRDPAAARKEAEQARFCKVELDRALEQQADLRITAPVGGRIVAGIHPRDAGRFLRAGDSIASIISGRWQARAVLSSEEFSAAQPAVGQSVMFRVVGNAEILLTGTIARVHPAGSRQLDLPALTHLAGGDVVLDAQTGEATQPYFELVIDLDDPPADTIQHGMTGVVRLSATPEPIARRVYRRIIRFSNRLLQN